VIDWQKYQHSWLSLDLIRYSALPLLPFPTLHSWEAGHTRQTRHNIPLYLGHMPHSKATHFWPLYHVLKINMKDYDSFRE
jgi:hypothetical protein